MRTLPALAAGTLLLGLGLAGCSSSSDEPMVGGMTECTEAILGEAAVGYVESIDATNTFSLDTLECADGWAVVGGILGPKDAPADGPQGAPAALIFEQEGQFWIPKEAADVCGTYTDGTYPADAQVPEALYPAGCLV
jgi:hypothetical protein